MVSIDPGLLDDTIERVNITLLRRVFKCLETLARACGESRSGHIAMVTLERPRSVAESRDMTAMFHKISYANAYLSFLSEC